MDLDCASVFNRLSMADRLKLRSAALTKALTGFARDDTATYPWRYPLYAAFIITVATPLPFPFASTILVAATLLWAKTSRSELAQRLNGRLRDSFNHAALVEEHKAFIKPDPEKTGSYRIRNLALAWDTTKKSFDDTRQATVYAWRSFKNFVMR